MRPAAVSAVAIGAVVLGGVTLPGAQPTAHVSLVRVPDGGIQPQAVADRRGAVHVIYFKGQAGAGDLFYAQLGADGAWTPPLRVNSQEGSAIAAGSVRGGQIAVDASGRPHVAWNGSSKAIPAAPGGATPMLYTRLNDARTGFEPQRNLIRSAVGLDGGGAIAAGGSGRVIVAWHAGGPVSKGEGDRRVWVAASTDAGRTFAPERAVSDAAQGACGCCGMDAAIDKTGAIYLLHRSARDTVHRDSFVLTSRDGARTFTSTRLQEWNINACPMSTFSLAEGPTFTIAAWETAGQVQFTRVSPVNDGQRVGGEAGTRLVVAPGDVPTRRHPSLAVNAAGETLLAWTEGTGWQKGGSLAWQLFTWGYFQPVGDIGRAPGVPVWGLVAAVARRDGSFVIVY